MCNALKELSKDQSQAEHAQLQASPVPRVKHVQQTQNWDCGLACCAMILHTLGLKDYDLDTLEQLANTRSIWTIDIAHVLVSCGLTSVSFLTTMVGVNHAHTSSPFYAKTIARDRTRVENLFLSAASKGITIREMSISKEQLQRLLLTHIIILLVDKALLPLSTVPSSATTDFMGHYIVVSGYDEWCDEYLIHDPAAENGCSRIGADLLEHARRAQGTDEDVLLIQRLR